MYKIIACDVDETLLNTDSSISPKNIEAIKKARELGVKFVVASGRAYFACNEVLKTIGLYDQKDEYTLSFNGAVITENKDSKILYSNGIAFEKAKQLFMKGVEYPDLCVKAYAEDGTYAYRLFDSERAFLIRKKINNYELDEPNIDFLKNKKIIKILFVNEDEKRLRQIYEEVKEIASGTQHSYSSNRYLEFNNDNVSKGTGLERLASLLGVDMKDTIAIGDNNNDMSMIEKAGLGICVANGTQETKDISDVVLDKTNNQDAIAEVIEKYVLKN